MGRGSQPMLETTAYFLTEEEREPERPACSGKRRSSQWSTLPHHNKQPHHQAYSQSSHETRPKPGPQSRQDSALAQTSTTVDKTPMLVSAFIERDSTHLILLSTVNIIRRTSHLFPSSLRPKHPRNPINALRQIGAFPSSRLHRHR